MKSSLTLLCGMGLSFMLCHFPVLGGGVGFFVGSLTILLTVP